MEKIINLVALILLSSGFFWVLGVLGQFFNESRNYRWPIHLPVWLSRLCGSRTNYVDGVFFSLQFLALLLIPWSTSLDIFYPQGQSRAVLFWRGFTLLLFVSLISCFVLHIYQKNKS